MQSWDDEELWIVTANTPSDRPESQVGQVGQKGSNVRGFNPYESAVPDPVWEEIKDSRVKAAKLEAHMSQFVKIVGRIFGNVQKQVEPQSDLQLDEITLSVEISGEGEIKLLGTGVKTAGKGAIELKFKRVEKSSQLSATKKVELRSVKGIDYAELEELLKFKQWRDADELTAELMQKLSGREEEGWLNKNSIKALPCEDLQTIDQLWVHYSEGKFGFNVQKKLWQQCGGRIGDWDPHSCSIILQEFLRRVGCDGLNTYDELFMNNTLMKRASLPLFWWGGLMSQTPQSHIEALITLIFREDI